MKLTVSVIIPVHTRLEYLANTLQSIYQQTRPVDKVYVVSDRSDALEVVSPFFVHDNLTYCGSGETDMAEKLNYGMFYSQTDTLFYLCDDDMLTPTYVEKALDIMEKTGVDIVYCDMELFGIDQGVVKALDWKLENFQETTAVYGPAIMKKRVWEKLKFVDMPYLDWDFWWRACEARFTAHHLEEPLFLYRTHSGQFGRTVDMDLCTKEVKKKHANSANNTANVGG
jgi:glycosyltransferase involved in cell wall biosynthesis